MKNANELRIGNYVLFNYKCDRIGIVEWIQSHSVSIGFIERAEDLTNGVCASPENLIPIELTEDIIAKCGFEKIRDFCFGKHQTKYSLGEFVCIIYDGEKFKWIMYDARPMLHIKYLHQLQNLYFAITGKDLSIEQNALIVGDYKS